MSAPRTIADFDAALPNGERVSLADKAGKVLLIVNTASKCGLTPQYAGLEALWRKYGDRGLEVIGFPCNQFAGQEPGTAEEISGFCSLNYDVSFPLMAKIEGNGPGAAPLYEWLKAEKKGGERIPFRYTIDDGGPFAFAGLWRRNRIAGELVLSACILTTSANSVCAPVHDRMPCILAGPDEEAAWLAGEADGLLVACDAERTTVAPANPAVNKAGVEGVELLTPPPQAEPTQLSLDT